MKTFSFFCLSSPPLLINLVHIEFGTALLLHFIGWKRKRPYQHLFFPQIYIPFFSVRISKCRTYLWMRVSIMIYRKERLFRAGWSLILKLLHLLCLEFQVEYIPNAFSCAFNVLRVSLFVFVFAVSIHKQVLWKGSWGSVIGSKTTMEIFLACFAYHNLFCFVWSSGGNPLVPHQISFASVVVWRDIQCKIVGQKS